MKISAVRPQARIPSKSSQKVSSRAIENLKIFLNISRPKLREIFELASSGASRISKSDVLQLVDTFFREFVFSIEADLSQKEDMISAVENLKCVLNEIAKQSGPLKINVSVLYTGFLIRDFGQFLCQQSTHYSAARQVQATK